MIDGLAPIQRSALRPLRAPPRDCARVVTPDGYDVPVSSQANVIERVRSRPLVLVFVALVGAAIVAGILIVSSSGSSSPKSATSNPAATPATATPTTKVQAASLGTLRSLPGSLGHPVYWNGPQTGTTYELTTTPDGRVYIRYLTGGAKVGSPLPNFLTIGTYVVPNAEAAVAAAAAQPGAVRLPLKGGVAFYNRARPTSVYFAYSGSDVQIETYDPSAPVARQLVETGAIKPIS